MPLSLKRFGLLEHMMDLAFHLLPVLLLFLLCPGMGQSLLHGLGLSPEMMCLFGTAFTFGCFGPFTQMADAFPPLIDFMRFHDTPTLIQHGEFDQRVPIPNAYELYQGLQDVGAEAELVVYKGFGHGINKPKELLAAVWHNWQWFGKHIWGEDVELPLGGADEDGSARPPGDGGARRE